MALREHSKISAGNPGMKTLISAIDKIRDVCLKTGSDATIDFDFPQIAVIGCQSAGKSSVLQSIVGRDFLPRGEDIVTRQPLILQLINAESEYGMFNHCGDKKFTDFKEICKEIQAQTSRVTKNKGVSKEPISLRIYSPNVLNITLIDLPGTVQVSVGDQPQNIADDIKDMIYDYIRKDNCLLLAVTPATMALAVSSALSMAQDVDPEGLRTIGVITKLDEIGKGTNARKILDNELKPLRRGYVGVVNRSEQDLMDKKDITAALKVESDFFRKSKVYRDIADRLGTPYLQRVLNQQLTEHIQQKLPGLKDRLHKHMLTLEKEVEQFKDFADMSNPDSLKNLIVVVFRKLRDNFEKQISGLSSKDIPIDMDGLSNGVKIGTIFHEHLPREISAITMDGVKVRNEIANGVREFFAFRTVLPQYVPYSVYETVVKKQIQLLKIPVIMCIEEVVEQLTLAIQNCILHTGNYPNLQEFLKKKLITFIDDNRAKFKENILSLIEMELAFINIEPDDLSFVSLPLQKQIVHKGGLGVENLGAKNAVYWFVLTAAVLLCYDKEDGDVQFCLELNDLQCSGVSQDYQSQKYILTISRRDGRNVFHHYKEFEFSSKNGDEIKTWRQHLSLAIIGIKVEPSLERAIAIIYNGVDSYMSMVKKTTRNMVPKAITLYIIKELDDYINRRLFLELLSLANDVNNAYLFTLSTMEAEKMKRKLDTYEALKEALKIIRDVLTETDITSTAEEEE
ncbi:dynamin-like [Bradysia coprophila]|uniref:dynamin-like n=1 Tax=Bradysia coprophila TaxID=38358 RepID=UPI00187D893D|nr:dynamin-like [Bradysia coprophila]